MIYNGKEIPKLGFGLMRLPMLENDEIDIEQTKVMVDKFLAAGFTYFDTAYGYLKQRSEVATKLALVDRYPRESFQLATKLPAWAGAENAEQARNMFFTSLERTGAGYFDFYLLHNLGPKRTEVFEDYDLWSFVAEQKELGKIKKLGFSIHDKADALDEVLTKHPEVDFVQLQINYADWNDLVIQSKLCYETAKKHNKPVIIMEPIRGGLLANPPEEIANVLKEANPDVSASSWALRYAASLDNVITVLSGMSNIEQMEDNIKTFTNFKPLDENEVKVIENVQEIFANIPSIPCTNCQYCVKGCPVGVAIPGIFSAMNKYLMYNSLSSAKESYNFTTKNGGLASSCIGCGACETVCPQVIPIVSELARASETLEK